MKKVNSDKQFVPVPGRGEKVDGRKAGKGRAVALALISAMLVTEVVIAHAAEEKGVIYETEAPVTQPYIRAVTSLRSAFADGKEDAPTVYDEDSKPDKSLYNNESQAALRKATQNKDTDRKMAEKITEEITEDVVKVVEGKAKELAASGTVSKTTAAGKASKVEASGKASGTETSESVSNDEVSDKASDEAPDKAAEEDVGEESANDLLQTPVENFTVTSPFGPRWGGMHTGIDLALPQGEPICAAHDGTVCFSGSSGGYGNLVKIDRGDGMQTCYAHCSQLLVAQGQQVEQGEEIALVGSTGNSTGPHLHFEVRIDGNCMDPADYLLLE